MNRRTVVPGLSTVVVGYALTLALLLAASFWPGTRAWGLAAWGYLSLTTRMALLLLGLFLGAGALGYAGRTSESDETSNSGRAWLWYLGIPLAAGLLFYFLRGATHFLADGYGQVARLAEDATPVPVSRFGAATLEVWVRHLFGGGEEAALNAYRTISIGSGVLFSAATWFTARRLFNSIRARILFAAGMLTGGYALLFFGYVSHYAFFCLAVALFAYTGLLIAQGHLRRWWIVPAFLLAVGIHLFGLVLFPAALYVLLHGTPISRTFARWSTPVRGAIWIVIVVKTSLLLGYLYATNYAFQLAFVPLLPGPLVVEGYTLLSARHLADWASLAVCLMPAILVIAFFVQRTGWRTLLKEPSLRFLVFAGVGTVVASFFLDPSHGMPGDWGMFAFAAVPVAVLFYYLTCRDSSRSSLATSAALLGLALGLLTLLPRAVVQHTPRKATAQLEDYAHLDVRRSRTSVVALTQYLLDEGYVKIYPRVRAFRDSVYVEDNLAAQGGDLVRQQRFADVRRLATQLISLDPRIYSGWLYLGKVYQYDRRNDSALVALKIADALNPENTTILNELGMTYYYLQQKQNAEHAWLESADIDPGQFAPHYSLARIYREQGDNPRYIQHLRVAAMHDDAPASVSMELADYYLSRREFDPAKAAIYRALKLGADSTAVRALDRKYPGLINWQGLPSPVDSTDDQPR